MKIQVAPVALENFFISDQDGVPDVYRLNIASGQAFRVTHVATGISGITQISPALSVSRQTGRMLFNTFYDQGQEIRGLDAARTMGSPPPPPAVAEGAQLPPPNPTRSLVTGYLADATGG